jgi:hypothetical protein
VYGTGGGVTLQCMALVEVPDDVASLVSLLLCHVEAIGNVQL